MTAERKDVPSVAGTPTTVTEAQEEVEMLREAIKALCRSLTEELMTHQEKYLVRLACALMKRQHNCSQITRTEYIPVLHEKNIQKFNEYNHMEALKEALTVKDNRPSIKDRLQ